MIDATESGRISIIGRTMTIEQPISCTFEPLPDITAYELAQLFPYFCGRVLLKTDWDHLGDVTRHLKKESSP